jgi:hypothetical protein
VNYSLGFGLGFSARTPLVVEPPANLLADAAPNLAATSKEPDLTVEQETQLWVQAQPLFEQLKQSPEGANAMWIPNLTGSGLLAGAAALVATSPVLAADNYVFGVCEISRPDSGVEIRPTTNGDSYLARYHNSDPRFSGFSFDGEGLKVTVIKRPPHGRVSLTDDPMASSWGLYHYTPDAGYIGKDRFVMQVEKSGIKVRINYLIESVDANEAIYVRGDDGLQRMLYCNPESWKISQSDFNSGSQDYAAWQRASQLSSLLASSSQSFAGFQDLADAAVGNTSGEGSNAAITLDFTAAGHGWYVDATPFDNTDDYLPTSNPNIWQAKAGTDAAGKMDMLSVLLHEYGHALGLEHSADSGDFMAATLQAGERRLPSADELTLMSQLVAQLKASTALADGSTPTDPTSPTVPNPSLPLGALLIGRLALGRKPEDAEQGSQALFSANPTLQGGNLSTLQDWATQGSVVTSSAAGGAPTGATLSETGSTQTRLNQVFMVGPQDRFLSFTLSNLALDDATNGPDDAFEAALLNANTGADLLSPLALSHTDALLNLQAGSNGLAELAAQGVTHVTHLDGSRTYLVDLLGIARDADGTVAVNLSFDLIGFGATAASMGSHVQVSDVRLMGLPQAMDDSFSGTEDNTLTLNALANDTDAVNEFEPNWQRFGFFLRALQQAHAHTGACGHGQQH